MEQDAFELIDIYAREIEIDTHVDVINIMQKLESSPNIKHKWLYKAMQAKRKLLELIEQKEDIVNKRMENNPIQLSRAAIKNKSEGDPEIVKLNREIGRYELLVEYLDRAVDKIFGQMGFDFTNIVNLLKQEQLS